MTERQDELWEKNYEALMRFVRENKRRPSKHNPEDRKMLSWIKFNKKRYARGQLKEERKQKFDEYLKLADKYRRYNMKTYANPDAVLERQLKLIFD